MLHQLKVEVFLFFIILFYFFKSIYFRSSQLYYVRIQLMYAFNTFVNEPFKESFFTTFMRNIKDY